MRIGIFSDVHGHIEELGKTLKLFEEQEVDRLICTGDLVDKGKNSADVIRLMREKAIPCVQGNHDFKARFTWFMLQEDALDGDSIDYLSNLPKFLSYKWENTQIHFCHANPWEDFSIYVYPTRPSILFEQVAEAVAAKIIVMGHTHHPMRVEIADKLLLNAGSIYGNRDRAERTCAILSLPDCAFQLYDIDTGKELAF